MVNGKQRKFRARSETPALSFTLRSQFLTTCSMVPSRSNLFVLAHCTIRATIFVSLGISRSRVAGSKARYLNM
jgi:hypothetical protein